jgi:hypothetical protein
MQKQATSWPPRQGARSVPTADPRLRRRFGLERVQQKWKPVLRPDTRQNKDIEQDDDSKNFILL